MRSPLAFVRFHLDHRWSSSHMSEYVDGELTGAAQGRLDHHLGECHGCRELLRSLRAMLGGLRGLAPAGAEERSVASSVLAGVRHELAEDGGQDPRA